MSTTTLPLIKALELPLPATLTRILGIHQSDIIIKSAIVVGLADLRANPNLLNYVFASLPQDPITWKEYGEKDVNAAKNWFLKTNVPTSVLPQLDESKWPQITIELLESSEVTAEATLGDVNYEPNEYNDSTWPPLTPQFTPIAYNPTTGAIKISVIPEAYVAPGMFLVDRNGQSHEIVKVLSQTEFYISEGTVADLRNCVLKSHKPSWQVSAESSSFKETYRIGIHVQNEPGLLSWLHSIVVFSLMRYKQVLLEGRGFERSTIQSTQMARDERFETENIYSRYITITGYVRQFWPKNIGQVIDTVEFDRLEVRGENAHVRVAGTGVDPKNQLWVGDLDYDGYEEPVPDTIDNTLESGLPYGLPLKF